MVFYHLQISNILNSNFNNLKFKYSVLLYIAITEIFGRGKFDNFGESSMNHNLPQLWGKPIQRKWQIKACRLLALDISRPLVLILTVL